jgi:hypothetical protein
MQHGEHTRTLLRYGSHKGSAVCEMSTLFIHLGETFAPCFPWAMMRGVLAA